jgi:hypothetical protein
MSFSKEQKRILRELAAECHEWHLRTLLENLYEDFQKWVGDSIGSFELTERIHKFHDGAARDLYKIYVLAPPEFAICFAINNSVISLDAIDPEIYEEIQALVAKNIR